MTDTAIERRQGDALSQIVGTGDTRAALATLEQNVRDIIDVCRERGFVTHYTNVNKKTGEVRESDFYGLPAWQLLGMTYGVTPIVTDLQGIDGGYKAYAVARTRDGVDVGGDFGLCHRKEGGKEYKSEHDLAAMASARAKRNALRAAFGAALVLAGFDFPDPDAPATKEQVGLLHQLEREIGWDHDQGHVEAGDVASYKDLTREQASELIERWTALRDEMTRGASVVPESRPGTGAEPAGEVGRVRSAESPGKTRLSGRSSQTSGTVSTSLSGAGAGEPGSSSEQGTPEEAEVLGEGAEATSGAPALDQLWHQAIAAGLTTKKAVPFAKANGIKVNQAYELDAEQMTVLLAKWRERGK